MGAELIPITMFVSFAVIAVVFFLLRFRGKREIQRTIRLALEKNHELSPDLLASLEEGRRTPESDFRRGLVGIAIGIAFAAFAAMVLELVSAGTGVTTKYALFVAVSNQAISYTTAMDGWASTFRDVGTRGTLFFDFAITLAGIALLAAVVVVARKFAPRAQVAATARA